MKIKRVFNWAEDQNGNEGWMMAGMPDFDALTQGFGIAHDTLEHLDFEGGVENEFRAFGAMLHIRGMGQWFYNYATDNRSQSYELMGHDLATFLWQCQLDFPAVRGLPARDTRALEDSDAEEELFKVCRVAMREVRSEWREDYALHEVAVAVRAMRDWIRVGYRRAVKRYGPDAFQLSELFQRICEAVDDEHTQGSVGDQLIIRVNTKTGEHAVERKGY